MNNKIDSVDFCDKIEFNSNNDTVTINRDHFILEYKENQIELTILSKSILDELSYLKEPVITFCNNNIISTAIGVGLFNSSIQDKVDYFYPLDIDKRVYFFNENKIHIKKYIKIDP